MAVSLYPYLSNSQQSHQTCMHPEPRKTVIDFTARKTEAGWNDALDAFSLRLGPFWFTLLGWVAVLGAFQFLSTQFPSSSSLLYVVRTSYFVLWLYLQSVFYSIEFKGLPLLRSPNRQLTASIILSGVLWLLTYYFIRHLVDLVSTKVQSGAS
jgi:hypothetical protein